MTTTPDPDAAQAAEPEKTGNRQSPSGLETESQLGPDTKGPISKADWGHRESTQVILPPARRVFEDLAEDIWVKVHRGGPPLDTDPAAGAWRVVRSALASPEIVALLGEAMRNREARRSDPASADPLALLGRAMQNREAGWSELASADPLAFLGEATQNREARRRDAPIATVDSHGGQAAEPEGAGLNGDPQTVNLLVGSAATTLRPIDLLKFVHATLEPTIRRLETEVEPSPESREQLTDIVIVAVQPFIAALGPAGRELLLALFGYLTAAGRGTTTGFQLTVSQLAAMWPDTGEDSWRERAFVYNHALWGMRHVAEQSELTEFDRISRDVVSIGAANLAVVLFRLLREDRKRRPADAAALPGGEVVRRLRMLSAVTGQEAAVDDDRATEALTQLGVQSPSPRAMLVIVDRTGRLADAWQIDEVDRARLEASAAVANIVTNERPVVASQLFSAAASLDRPSEASEPRYIRARLLLNALGLHWAAKFGEGDMPRMMGELNGLDSAVNLLGDIVIYKETVGTDNIWPVLERLAQFLIALPNQLGGSPWKTDFARLERAGRRLALSAAPDLTVARLNVAVDRLIDAVRPVSPDQAVPRAFRGDAEVADLLDTAALIRGTFETSLGRETWGLRGFLDELLERRHDPIGEFRRSFWADPDDPLARSPLSAIELPKFGMDTWYELARRLDAKHDSIVPYLHALPG